jgi:hypothetical protein
LRRWMYHSRVRSVAVSTVLLLCYPFVDPLIVGVASTLINPHSTISTINCIDVTVVDG